MDTFTAEGLDVRAVEVDGVLTITAAGDRAVGRVTEAAYLLTGWAHSHVITTADGATATLPLHEAARKRHRTCTP